MNRFSACIDASKAVAVAAMLVLCSCQPDVEGPMVGTLERDRIELKVESSEPLVAINIRDGQEVTTGELILEQDPNRALARRSQQTALRDQASARLAELERGPRQEAIRQSRAELESFQAQTVEAAANLRRAQGVFDKGLSSQATVDLAQANWKTAKGLEDAANQALAALLNGTTPEELQQAVAALAAAQALLNQADIDLERTRLLAPQDGIVDKVLFRLGERPPAGTTVAVLLANSRVYARIYVPEHWRSRIQPGDTLNVRLDGIEKPMTGTVRWVSSDASFTPYFALTEYDRSRLSYLAEVDLPSAADLPSGLPLQAEPAGSGGTQQ